MVNYGGAYSNFAIAEKSGSFLDKKKRYVFVFKINNSRKEFDVNKMIYNKYDGQRGLIRRALAIVSISLAMALGGTMLLTLLEGDGQPFLDMMFEAFSAMATVGVSSAGTPNLSAGSKTVLALMMFFGRVGPLTMASALASRQNRNASKIRYPEEEITIG